jgi:hypothetical protein
MSWASKTYTFSPSTTIRSSEINQNFTDLVDAINIAMPSSASGHGIILFSGAIVSIPTGWYLCNGNNGTPNLTDKFVIGAGNSYAVGATGGALTINIAHTHTVNSHTHTGPSHAHYIDYYTYNDPSASDYDDTFEAGDDEDVSPAGSNHRHHITTWTGYEGTGNTGGATPGTDSQLSATQSILPPYYALAYIMKS